MKEAVFSRPVRIERPVTEVFAWHERPGALARLCPPWERVEVGEATGGVRDGARVVVRAKVGPVWTTWRVEHRDYVAGVQFSDVQVSGPFARWEHVHRFEEDGPDACRLTDEITYRLPGGAIGWAMGGGFVRRKLERLFGWRQATTKADLERGPVVPRRILIAGASGLVGTTLVPFLQTQGHAVLRLVRRKPARDGEVFWSPATGELAADALEGVDAIVNLSGANVGAGRWTARRRAEILSSRVDATAMLVRAMERMRRRPEVFVSAAAAGIYGDRGDEVLTEGATGGGGFLAEVCRRWEAEARRAEDLGVRTARLRFGVVLTPAGGALAKLLPVFRAGVGGRVGNGRQWMSWIGIDDAVAAIYHAIVEPQCSGAIHVVAPQAVTNADFAAALGRVLRRPAVLPVPAAVLRAVFGQMADETLLSSARLVPRRLEATRFAFRAAELETALRQVLGRE